MSDTTQSIHQGTSAHGRCGKHRTSVRDDLIGDCIERSRPAHQQLPRNVPWLMHLERTGVLRVFVVVAPAVVASRVDA